jgi:DNA-binding NtrC family response regulator
MATVRDEQIRRYREAGALGKLIGEARTFREAMDIVRVAARSDAAVLLSGETGTGKELAARAIHYLSDRAAGPFVAVNCGSLTDTLLEDELFGHEKGAFTDARHPRLGLIAQANRGTLFLDEIDSLTVRGQVAMLRVLQDKVYRPLGSQREHHAEVRIVAASNARLPALVECGAFRADLFYRLCVFAVALPPLRERREDIVPLAKHFLNKHLPADVAVAPALSGAAQDTLRSFHWPGNVRELENAMIRAVRLCDGDTIERAHLGLAPAPPPPELAVGRSESEGFQIQKIAAIRRFEHDYVTRLLAEAGGNITRAARIAGTDRRDLGKLLKKHGLGGRSSATRVGSSPGPRTP